jgi:hypothetical protein
MNEQVVKLSVSIVDSHYAGIKEALEQVEAYYVPSRPLKLLHARLFLAANDLKAAMPGALGNHDGTPKPPK